MGWKIPEDVDEQTKVVSTAFEGVEWNTPMPMLKALAIIEGRSGFVEEVMTYAGRTMARYRDAIKERWCRDPFLHLYQSGDCVYKRFKTARTWETVLEIYLQCEEENVFASVSRDDADEMEAVLVHVDTILNRIFTNTYVDLNMKDVTDLRS